MSNNKTLLPNTTVYFELLLQKKNGEPCFFSYITTFACKLLRITKNYSLFHDGNNGSNDQITMKYL